MSDEGSWQAMTPGAPDGPGTESSSDGGGEKRWPGQGNELDAAFGMETPGGGRRKINEGLLLLGLVLVVATGALIAMRKGGAARIDQSIGDVELKIETALAQLGVGAAADPDDPRAKLLRADTDAVIARFMANPAEQQVPIHFVQKNPFALFPEARPVVDAPQPNKPVASFADRQREARLQKLRTEFDQLRLQTVMNGRRPMAVISGKVVRASDRIGSFTVTSIEPMTVTLTAEGNTYRLSMDQPDLHRH